MSARPAPVAEGGHAQPRATRALAAARAAQPAWAGRGVRGRLPVIAAFRRLLAEQAPRVAAAARGPHRRSTAETVSAELLPLADAARFLERRAARILRPRRPAGWGPAWLGGVGLEVRREPLGVVLVIGPGNYPLLLPGVQALQALAAGNAVLLKPAPGGRPVALALAELLAAAGLPAGLLAVLPESPREAQAAIDAGVDRVVLTGSADTGSELLERLAPSLIPATLELSGCDACFVLADADLELTARAVAFGMTLNGGATCIAPRRIFVARQHAAELERRLALRLDGSPPLPLPATTAERLAAVVGDALGQGARLVAGGAPSAAGVTPVLLADARPGMDLFAADLMAPVAGLCPVDSEEEALDLAARCPYALGATVFGGPRSAVRVAARARAGVVVINDVIAPTADPRLTFGGRGRSGFGRTRGVEGLEEMTTTKTLVRRRTRWRPHLGPPRPHEERALFAILRLLHGGSLRRRLAALTELSRAAGPSPGRNRSGGPQRSSR
ncbi:MAG: aldehyde dehydrogenase family protein [Thermoanaerobaculia bacterium]|nr:aldehyde dehydrogenase family protein [Thermoanaerobaculia bacterium]